ncbi:MAG: hypothetical protein D6746_10905, partial [Bacteroidetes bacterium]
MMNEDNIFKSPRTEEEVEELVKYLRLNARVDEEDYQRMERNFAIVDGELEPVREWMRRCGIEDDIIDMVSSYNKMPGKIALYKGLYEQQIPAFRPILMSTADISKKNREYMNLLAKQVSETLNWVLRNTKDPQQAEQAIQAGKERIEELKYFLFKNSHERFLEGALRMTMAKEDIYNKMKATLESLIITDRAFIEEYWQDGEPHLRVLNPLTVAWSKSESVSDVSKGRFVAYSEVYTIEDALDKFVPDWRSTNPTKKVKERVGKFIRNYLPDRKHKDIDPLYLWDIVSPATTVTWPDRSMMYDMGQVLRSNVEVMVYEVRVYRDVWYLTSYDNEGIPEAVILDKAFKPPEDAVMERTKNRFGIEVRRYRWNEGDLEHYADKMMIPRRYRIVTDRFGTIITHGEPRQPDNIVNPFLEFSLSIKGGLRPAINGTGYSLVDRAFPYHVSYMMLMSKYLTELSRFQLTVSSIDASQIDPEMYVSQRDADGTNIIQNIVSKIRRVGYMFYN